MDSIAKAPYNQSSLSQLLLQAVHSKDTGTVPCTNGTDLLAVGASKTSPDAFLYIVVVLAFYALAMIILLIKYIQRENEEARLTYYYSEFIKREQFDSAQYENRANVTKVRQMLAKLNWQPSFSCSGSKGNKDAQRCCDSYKERDTLVKPSGTSMKENTYLLPVLYETGEAESVPVSPLKNYCIPLDVQLCNKVSDLTVTPRPLNGFVHPGAAPLYSKRPNEALKISSVRFDKLGDEAANGCHDNMAVAAGGALVEVWESAV